MSCPFEFSSVRFAFRTLPESGIRVYLKSPDPPPVDSRSVLRVELSLVQSGWFTSAKSKKTGFLAEVVRVRQSRVCGFRPNAMTPSLQRFLLAWVLGILGSPVLAETVLDPTFSLDPSIRGQVDSICVRLEGRILLGGKFKLADERRYVVKASWMSFPFEKLKASVHRWRGGRRVVFPAFAARVPGVCVTGSEFGIAAGGDGSG